jgi:hypothetical protein
LGVLLPNFTIEGRRKNLPDPQRTFNWEVEFVDLPLVAKKNYDEDDLKLRAKSATFAGRSVEPIETFYQGNKQIFPGRTNFTNSINIQFEETEDQKVTKILFDWFQKINNMNAKNIAFGGTGSYLFKGQVAKKMYLKMYKYNGEAMKYRIKFNNVWPQSMPDISMSYDTSDVIKFDVAFAYDFWILETNNFGENLIL